MILGYSLTSSIIHVFLLLFFYYYSDVIAVKFPNALISRYLCMLVLPVSILTLTDDVSDYMLSRFSLR